MYTEKVMDHFQNPRNMGEIENASGVGTVGNAKCGDIMRIYLDIDENQIICIEDLKVKNMIKNHKLARSINDASWSRFISMLVYKANWYGKTIIKVPSNYPSSQLCSCCHYQNPKTKDLNVRKWICPQCGTVHDRDKNAAKNILSKGIEIFTKDGTHPDSLSMLGSLESSSKKPPLR